MFGNRKDVHEFKKSKMKRLVKLLEEKCKET